MFLCELFVFVILCGFGVKARLEGKSAPRFSYNSVQKIIHLLSLIAQNQRVANIVCLQLLYKIFHTALDECCLEFISSNPDQTEVQK